MVKKVAAVTFAAFALIAIAGRADAGNKCQGAKLKLAGKKASCRVALDAKQASSGTAKDPTKDMACGGKFSAAFTKLEGKGGCLTSGDESMIEGKVDSFESAINGVLAPPGGPPAASKCQGAKLKAASKEAACLLSVKATTAAKALPADDPAKVTKCTGAFNSAFTKANGGADCTSMTDESAASMAIASFVDNADTMLDVCAPLVTGQPVAGTYHTMDIAGPSFCQLGATSNELGPCTTASDCGGSPCVPTPFISAGGITLPFPLGIDLTYTIATAATRPDSGGACSHDVCISCGNPNATCPGMLGCTGNPKCVSNTCCDTPAFVVPTFLLAALNTCVKVDQKACGTGVINNSNPQTGDNEVNRVGDTTDPGADCMYGTPDDPVPTTCDTATGDEGGDTKGKIVRTQGNGMPDSAGVQSRFTAPIMATAWTDKPTTPAGSVCPGNATFDAHNCVGGTNAGAACTTGVDCNSGNCSPGPEILLAQLILPVELTTAGSSGAFVDLSGDGCAFAGVAFGGGNAGPVVLASPTVSPAPYGGGSNLMGSVGLTFPGNGPLNDSGFMAIVPFAQPTTVATQSCSCTPISTGCLQ